MHTDDVDAKIDAEGAANDFNGDPITQFTAAVCGKLLTRKLKPMTSVCFQIFGVVGCRKKFGHFYIDFDNSAPSPHKFEYFVYLHRRLMA